MGTIKKGIEKWSPKFPGYLILYDQGSLSGNAMNKACKGMTSQSFWLPFTTVWHLQHLCE